MSGPRLLIGLLALVLALGAVACGGDDEDEGEDENKVTGVQALPASSCEEVEFGGEGEPSR